MKKFLLTSALSLALLSSSTAFAEPSDDHHGKGYHKRMEKNISKLPKDKQELVKKSMEEGNTAFTAEREQMKKLHEELRTILTAPEFDKKAFLAKGKQLQDIHNTLYIAHNERIATLASQMNAEERKVLVNMIPGGRMHKKHDGDMKDN